MLGVDLFKDLIDGKHEGVRFKVENVCTYDVVRVGNRLILKDIYTGRNIFTGLNAGQVDDILRYDFVEVEQELTWSQMLHKIEKDGNIYEITINYGKTPHEITGGLTSLMYALYWSYNFRENINIIKNGKFILKKK